MVPRYFVSALRYPYTAHTLDYIVHVRLLVRPENWYVRDGKQIAGPTEMATDVSDPMVRRPVNIRLLTVSDTRTAATDTSGQLLEDRIVRAGHTLLERAILRDDLLAIEERLQSWCKTGDTEVIITSGGTGLTGRDVTADIMERMFEKSIPGFGELFRYLSYAHPTHSVGTSALQSRATAGLGPQKTLMFALPGSPRACELAWDEILRYQLDIDHRPCNFVSLFPRFNE